MSAALTAKPETQIDEKRLEENERDIPVLEADGTLARLAEQFAADPHEAVAVITRQGTPALAVLSLEYFESLLETLEVMGDEEAMAAIRNSEKDIAEGRTYAWEDVKRELDL